MSTYVYTASGEDHRLTPEPSDPEAKGAVDLDDLSEGGLVIVLNTKEDVDLLRTLVNEALIDLENAHLEGLDEEDLIEETKPEDAEAFTLRRLVDFGRDLLEMAPYGNWTRCLQAETTRDCSRSHLWYDYPDGTKKAFHTSR